MLTKALYVRMEAKPGMEDEVEQFLRDGLPLAAQEPGTTFWTALRLSESTFAIFDAFENEEGRTAHLAGQVAEALAARGEELFSVPPRIEPMNVLAAKVPSA